MVKVVILVHLRHVVAAPTDEGESLLGSLVVQLFLGHLHTLVGRVQLQGLAPTSVEGGVPAATGQGQGWQRPLVHRGHFLIDVLHFIRVVLLCGLLQLFRSHRHR